MYAQKSKSNTSRRVRYIVLTAMFAAIITAATALLKIGTPVGYVHAGDAVIYLAASVLPFPFGVVAAALGGALADLMSGFAVWMLPTALIKSLNALCFTLGAVYLRKRGKSKIICPVNILMLLPAALVTLGGYFVAELIMYDFGAAAAELIPNLVQAATASLLYLVLGLGLDSVRFRDRIIK